jgi:3-oxoadipate enol-lactonase
MNFIEVNGTALRFEVSGSGERAVALIHEMGGTLESWDGVAPLLARHRRVLRYDTRGAGLSQKVRGALSIDTMTDDLIALMDAAGIAKAAFGGVAVGGAIALNTALRHPARVSAVVATSPAVAVAADRRAAVLARVDRIEREGMATAVDESFASGYPSDLRGDMARFKAFRARWLGNDPASYATIYRMLAATDLTGELTRIVCPTLIIGGRFDRTRPPATAEPVAHAIPGAQFKILESGHYMSTQTPELVAGAIAEFLDQAGV